MTQEPTSPTAAEPRSASARYDHSKLGMAPWGAARAVLPVTPVRPAYEQIADQLRDLVVSGDLRPGQRLPSEPELCSQFGVGRTTVREALRSLASHGMVKTRRGVTGGTFIIAPDRDSICRYLETSLGLLAGADRPGVNDLLEARMVLELPATRLAATRHDAAQLQVLAATVTAEPNPNGDRYQGRFHVAILEASGNKMLEVMTRPVFALLRTRLQRSAAPADFWDRVVADHGRILTAVGARDEEAAADAMREHLVHLSSVYSTIDTAIHPGLVSPQDGPHLVREAGQPQDAHTLGDGRPLGDEGRIK